MFLVKTRGSQPFPGRVVAPARRPSNPLAQESRIVKVMLKSSCKVTSDETCHHALPYDPATIRDPHGGLYL